MKMFGYLQGLSLAARWLLPQEEARAMAEDYREILDEAGEAEARQRFGPPLKAVLAVADRRQVVKWHLLFAALLLMVFFPLHWTMHVCYYVVESFALLAVAAAGLLFWFGVEKPLRPFHQKNRVLLAVFSLMAALVAVFCGAMFFLPAITARVTDSETAQLFREGLRISVPVFSLFSVVGVVLAKLFHRGWRAVAILSMTLVCLCINVMSFFGYMGPITLSGGEDTDFLLSIFNFYTSPGPVDLMTLMHVSSSSSLFIGAAGTLAGVVGLC